MKTSSKTILWVIIIIILASVAFIWWNTSKQATVPVTTVVVPPVNTYGMTEYTDPNYNFSFWYPNQLQIASSIEQNSTDFPGGVVVETLQVGPLGGTSVVVVNSPTGSITDEPAGHASPIAQTRYFYDAATQQWMVAYPEGPNGPGSGQTTAADISKTTISGLFMMPSGKRFDTTIIPLNTTQFLVISDGGGSSFTGQLAKTVSQTGVTVNASVQASALQAEASAYNIK